MKKIALALFVGSLITTSLPAWADMEPIEETLTFLSQAQEKKQTVEKKLEKVESIQKKARQGALGALKTKSSKVEQDKPSVEVDESISDSLGDQQKTEEAISQNTVANYTSQNQSQTSDEALAKNNAILRTDLARLYAFAFTLRTNMAKERQEGKDEDVDKSGDSRDMKLLAKKEAMEAAYRILRIFDMESSLSEFNLRLMARDLKNTADDEDGDSKSE